MIKYIKNKQDLAGRNYNLTSKTKTQYSYFHFDKYKEQLIIAI